ncbi:MAG: hypothetical protein IKS16_08640 [Lachnospiraceae bacterium]|nr:hypothetical protein [Lachnospiraceae bacterium]
MITVRNQIYTVTTANTSYVMSVPDGKNVEHLHYGGRITPVQVPAGTEGISGAEKVRMTDPESIITDDLTAYALAEKYNNPYGNAIQGTGNMTLDNICLEFSNAGTGDYRILPLILKRDDGCISTRFYFADSLIYEGLYADRDATGMPYAREGEISSDSGRPYTLELIFKNRTEGSDSDGKVLELRLIYTAFEDCDVIT